MTRKTTRRTRKKFPIGHSDMLKPGERRLIDVDGKRIGLFNVKGSYYALLNRCPHMAGNLCEGPITGTSLPTNKQEFNYGMEDELIRCGWHGWEFEIKSGEFIVDRRIKAKTYPVTSENGRLFLHI